jgi:TonB-linked SusC/RagA family outer membrane protein
MRKVTILLVFLLFVGVQFAIAQRTVTGRVTTAADGSPLAGVTVIVQGTTTGSLTDIDGRYSIAVPNDQAVLRFSFVGFTEQSVTVGLQSTINVVMEEATLQMAEVVVTALGISRESKSLGYAVTTVNVNDVLKESRALSVAQSLDGRVAGLNINVPSSGAGGSVAITLRGSGSPLLVVNGLPMGTAGGGNRGIGRDRGNDFNRINPDDIEEMVVLRGATAAALYGSRASNGAILITTKSGAGRGIGLEYTTNFQAQQMLDFFEFQNLFGQGRGGQKPTTVGTSVGSAQFMWGAPYDGKPYPIFDGSEIPYSYIGPRISEYYRLGKTFTNTLAFSGSTGGNDPKNRFRFSYSNATDKGLEPDNEYQRHVVNFNINHQILPKLVFSLSSNYSKENRINPPNTGGQGTGSMNYLTRMSLSIPLEKFKESAYDPVTGTERVTSGFQGTLLNPYYAMLAGFEDIRDSENLMATGTLRYDIADWLYIQGRYNYASSSNASETKNPGGIGTSNPFNSDGTYKGSYSRGSSWSKNINAEFLLGYNKRFGKFTTNANFGGNTRRSENHGVSVSGSNFVVRDFFSIGNATNKTSSNPSFGNSRTNSLYGMAEVSYNSTFYLNATGRTDWFSNLVKVKRTYQFYPSLSGSIVFSEFIKQNWLDYGKVRGSWTQVGNAGGISANYGLVSYSLATNQFNGIPTGSLSAPIVNLNITPFNVSEKEIGLEMRMFNDRLYADLALYEKRMDKQIYGVLISNMSGTGSINDNVGSRKYFGFESLIEYKPIVTNNFTWTTSWNNTWMSSKVLSLGVDEEGKPIMLSQTADWWAGGGANTFAGMSYDVVGKKEGQIFMGTYMRDANGNKLVQNNGRLVGTYRNPNAPQEGSNGNGMYNFGSGNPNHIGGWNNSFTYKNLSASILIAYRFGGKVISSTYLNMTRQGFSKLSLEGRVDENGKPMVNEDGSAKHHLVVDGVYANAGTHRDPVTNEMVPHNAGDKNVSVVTDLQTFYTDYRSLQIGDPFIFSSDYIKIRNISLSYNLTSAVSKLDFLKFVKGVTFSASVRNLAILYKDIPNVDPEQISTTGDSGYEGGALPVTRNYSFGLNVSF